MYIVCGPNATNSQQLCICCSTFLHCLVYVMTLIDSQVAHMYCLELCKTSANYDHTSNTDSVPLLSSYTITWQVHVHKCMCLYTIITTGYFRNVDGWLNTLCTWQGSKLPNITAKRNSNYCSVNGLSTVCTPGHQQHTHYTYTVGNCNHTIGRHANCSH